MTHAQVVLDTSAVIDLATVWESPELAAAAPVVSAVTIAELAYGLDTEDLLQRQARTDRFYVVLREMAVLPFDLAAARLYGTLAATVRRTGRDPRPRRLDLQIAATAGVHDLPLVTRNSDDFRGLERYVTVLGV